MRVRRLGGGVLLEVLLALSLVAVIGASMVGSVAVSRRVCSVLDARSSRVRAQVRALLRVCRCEDTVPIPEDNGSLAMGGGVSLKTVARPREVLVLARLSSRDPWVVACGLPCTARWMP